MGSQETIRSKTSTSKSNPVPVNDSTVAVKPVNKPARYDAPYNAGSLLSCPHDKSHVDHTSLAPVVRPLGGYDFLWDFKMTKWQPNLWISSFISNLVVHYKLQVTRWKAPNYIIFVEEEESCSLQRYKFYENNWKGKCLSYRSIPHSNQVTTVT